MHKQINYYADRPEIINDFSEGLQVILELGIGVNYYTDNWLFNVQPTFNGGYVSRFGVGYSV